MTPAKSRTVTFEGVPSGPDEGDFHWKVDRETFEKVTGREPNEDEVIGRGRYRLYPAQTAAPLRVNRRVRVRLSVTPM